MSTLWEDIRGSVFNFCNAFGDDMRTASIADLQLFDFDSHVETNALPASDLIGPWQLSCDVDFKFVTVRGMIGLSVLEDTNLFRLNQASGELLQRMTPDKIMPLYGAVSGAITGHLKVSEGTSLSPVAQAQQRSLKFLSFVLKGDRTFS